METQRNSFQDYEPGKDSMMDERKQKLDLIKFRFENKHELDWQRKYELAVAYYNYYGNSEIPKEFKTRDGITRLKYDEVTPNDKTVVELGYWCNTQRQKLKNYQHGIDSKMDEKKQKLELINFRFEDKNDLEWIKKYKLALTYYKRYGHSNIPDSFKTKDGITESTDEDAINLGSWCETQRNNFQDYELGKDSMMDERKQKLDLIKFRFENKYELDWQRKYELVLAYYNHYGHSEIPQKFKTKDGINYDKKGFDLGGWCAKQRTDFIDYEPGKDSMMDKKKRKLDSIKFRFEFNYDDLEWQRKYELVLAYYNHYGHSEIPDRFKTKDGIIRLKDKDIVPNDRTIVDLGAWCGRQRIKFKNYQHGIDSKMDEKKQKLELIGFRFNNNKENKEEKIELCNTYGIDYNKYKILDRMSYQELYAKIMFLLDSNLPLETDGKLHPIFTMCNENMMINYGISKEELITNYYINRKGRK